MAERLNVYLNGQMAGILDWDNALDVFAFRYLSSYLDADGARPISRSLPLTDAPFDALKSRTFFENLLPPEVVRRKLEKILHHDYRNTFAFLKELGGDCAGAISLYPEGMEPEKGEDVLRELTQDEADDVLLNSVQKGECGNCPSLRPALDGRLSKSFTAHGDVHWRSLGVCRRQRSVLRCVCRQMRCQPEVRTRPD